MSRYLKRFWSEGRGDEFDSWGPSWWFLEVDEGGNVVRQAELYNNGRLMRYSAAHAEDEFALAETSSDPSFAGYAEVSKEEFESIWHRC